MDSLCLLKSNPFFKLPPIVLPTDFNADVNAFECEGGGFHAENVFVGDIFACSFVGVCKRSRLNGEMSSSFCSSSIAARRAARKAVLHFLSVIARNSVFGPVLGGVGV